MGIDVRWFDERHNAILYTFQSPWDWDDYYAISGIAGEMFRDVGHKVAIIIDLTSSTGLPPGALTHLRRGINKEYDNRGTVILVGMNRFVQSMSSMMVRLFPQAAKQMRMVGTLEDARAVIDEVAAV